MENTVKSQIVEFWEKNSDQDVQISSNVVYDLEIWEVMPMIYIKENKHGLRHPFNL